MSKVEQTICSVYQAKTGKSRDEILNLMKDETWMTAEEAVDQGFANEVLNVSDNAPQVINSFEAIPVKAKVDEFMKMLMNSVKKNNENKSDNTQSSNQDSITALFNKKLSILKGE